MTTGIMKTMTTTTTLSVDSATADDIADPAACSDIADGGCNLRSAVARCTQLLTNTSQACIVSMPAAELVKLDPRLGELSIVGANGLLRLDGNGCVISPLGESGTLNNTRLLRVRDVGFGDELTFIISNVTIRGFGNSELNGGALSLERTSVVFNDVLFSNNTGIYGGAVDIRTSSFVRITSVLFERNIAGIRGGGIYFGNRNSNVKLTSCEFVGNVVSGEASDDGESMSMGKFKTYSCFR